MLATDMVHWSACMSAYAGQPPDPAVVGEGWRDAWRERLDAMEPWVATWLAHQRRDDYWRQARPARTTRGSTARCSRSAAGSTATATWSCAWPSMCARRCAGLIGPWGHTWPERGAPGPADRLPPGGACASSTARSRATPNGFLDEPRLVSWMQERIAPAASCAERPGRWVAEPEWPSPQRATLALALGTGRGAGAGRRSIRGSS